VAQDAQCKGCHAAAASFILRRWLYVFSKVQPIFMRRRAMRSKQ